MLRKVINFERGIEANLRAGCPVSRDEGDRRTLHGRSAREEVSRIDVVGEERNPRHG